MVSAFTIDVAKHEHTLESLVGLLEQAVAHPGRDVVAVLDSVV